MKKKAENDCFAVIEEKNLKKILPLLEVKKSRLAMHLSGVKNCCLKNYSAHTIKQQSLATPVKSMVAGHAVFFKSHKKN
jgi:hypothetical protein